VSETRAARSFRGRAHPATGGSKPAPRAARPRGGTRVTNTDRAYIELRRRILAGQLTAGSMHLEEALAAALAMSRTPVREACIRLEQEGLVEVRPRFGVLILPVSAADMAEIYELLTTLEALAARRAAERGVAAEALLSLEKTVAAMDAALAADDLAAWAEADRAFHDRLVALAGNARLAGVVATFMDQAHRARMQTLATRPRPAASNRDHRAVLEAIRRGDGAAAEAIHRRHREESGRMLVALLADLARRGTDGL
jgi:DNA-binding GntR family transcriptional regulator